MQNTIDKLFGVFGFFRMSWQKIFVCIYCFWKKLYVQFSLAVIPLYRKGKLHNKFNNDLIEIALQLVLLQEESLLRSAVASFNSFPALSNLALPVLTRDSALPMTALYLSFSIST